MAQYRLLRDVVEPGRHLLAGVTLDTAATHPLFAMDTRVIAAWEAGGWVERVPDPVPPPAEHGWNADAAEEQVSANVTRQGNTGQRTQPKRHR